METTEAIWTIVQLLFWLLITGVALWLCVAVLGLVLLIPKYLFQGIGYAVGAAIGLVLGLTLQFLSSTFWFFAGFVGLKPKERVFHRSNNSFTESSEKDNSTQQEQSSNVFNPYTILNVNPGADYKQIKEAYRKQMSQYHPDKVSHLGKELQAFAEEKAKSIQRAYSELQSA